MFRSMSLKTKLLSLTALLCGVAVAVGVTSYVSFKQVVGTYSAVVNEDVPNIVTADKIFLEYRYLRINLRSLGLEGIPKDVEDLSLKRVHEAIANVDRDLETYSKGPFMPGEEALFVKMYDTWKKFKALGGEILEHHKSKRPEDHAAMMQKFFYDCPAQAAVFTREMTELIDFLQATAKKRGQTAEASAQRANTLSFVLIFVGSLLGFGLGYILSSSISSQLRSIANGLSKEAEGVGDVAIQIANASESLSASTTQQASALQQTTAAIEETSAMIAKNAENAKISTEVSQQSESTVEKGRQAVEAMLHSIDDISRSNAEIMTQIEDSNREIADIVKVISEIGNKTKVINDIVFQTKLLSFNASVEAARAGEHGKGFAVVAEEVGNLAQMSGNSAKEISAMLEDSIKKVEGIVDTTKRRVDSLVQVGKQKVESGVVTAKRCTEILEEIVSNVNRVGSLVSEISVASQEQANGIAEINKAMAELDAVAQKNSLSSQESSKSSQDLRHQVDSVRELVSGLEAVLGGAAKNGQHNVTEAHSASRSSDQSYSRAA